MLMMAGHWNSPEDVPIGPKLKGREMHNEEVDVIAVGDVNSGCYALVQAPRDADADSPVWRVRGLPGTIGPHTHTEIAAVSGVTYATALRLARERAYRQRRRY